MIRQLKGKLVESALHVEVTTIKKFAEYRLGKFLETEQGAFNSVKTEYDQEIVGISRSGAVFHKLGEETLRKGT